MVAVCTQWGDERAKKMAMISADAVGDVVHGLVSYWSTTLKVCRDLLLLLTLHEIWFHLSTTKRCSSAEAKVIKVLSIYHKNLNWSTVARCHRRDCGSSPPSGTCAFDLRSPSLKSDISWFLEQLLRPECSRKGAAQKETFKSALSSFEEAKLAGK